MSLLSVIGGTEATGKGSVPFDRSTVISTRTAGLAASAEELAPRTATPLTLPTPPPAAPRPIQRPRRAEPRRDAPGACRDCDKRRAALELPEALLPELGELALGELALGELVLGELAGGELLPVEPVALLPDAPPDE